jgi:hypothetical protein
MAGGWRILNIGGLQWIVGDPTNITDTDFFGVGFIKGAATPHPLADCMNVKGIRYTYTWFGGPWMPSHGYPYIWGAYSSNLAAGTVIDLMMRVWVSYPWGMPILIEDVSQHCNTFNATGPYTIYADLEDDGVGINFLDTVQLRYRVNLGGDTLSVNMSPITPGSSTFYGNIPGQPIGSDIFYWIYTMDDQGLVNSSLPMVFYILGPENPNAELLLVDDNLSDRVDAYWEALDELDIDYEYWNVQVNYGIDSSVVNYGWDKVLVAGWGVSTVPALDDANAYSSFIANGGNFCLIDQDYFYANGLPPAGAFTTGDFAYDYLGVAQYFNDPTTSLDSVYIGNTGDPVTGSFVNNHYQTYWDNTGNHMTPDQFWVDNIITRAVAPDIFFGEDFFDTYGVRFETANFKTVFLSFMAEAACYYDSNFIFTPTDDFINLLENINNWFDGVVTSPINVTLTPTNPPIVIPSFGGIFQYTVSFLNQSTTNQTIDANIHAHYPTGIVFYVLTRPNMTMTPGAVITRVMTQFVPGTVPAGNYIYTAEARDHLTQAILDTASFPFTKTGLDDRLSSTSTWLVEGWEDETIADNIHPSSFILHPCSPNPFNASLAIRFELSDASPVDLAIYDISGREIETLDTRHLTLGMNTIVWNAEGLPSGVYFIQLSVVGGQSEVQKVMLLK